MRKRKKTTVLDPLGRKIQRLSKRWRLRSHSRQGALQFKPQTSFVTRFRRSLLLKAVLLFLFISSLLAWFLLRTPFFTVSSVDLQSTMSLHYIDQKELLTSLESELLNKKLFEIESDVLQQEFLVEYPALMAISFSRRPPNTVSVLVEERISLLKLRSADGTEYVADQQGVVFSVSKGENLPLIKMASDFSLGQTVRSKHLAFILDLSQYIDMAEVSEITFSAEGTVRFTINDVVYLFTLQKPTEVQIALFTVLQTHYRSQHGTLETVDVRFSRPVVSY